MRTPEQRFGHNVKVNRSRLGLTQEEVGHRAGLHPTEIGRLERGVREPRLGTMVKLASALGVTVSRLTEGVESWD